MTSSLPIIKLNLNNERGRVRRSSKNEGGWPSILVPHFCGTRATNHNLVLHRTGFSHLPVTRQKRELLTRDFTLTFPEINQEVGGIFSVALFPGLRNSQKSIELLKTLTPGRISRLPFSPGCYPGGCSDFPLPSQLFKLTREQPSSLLRHCVY